MKFIKTVFILCALLCVRLERADAATTHTVKGVVITSSGTVVPEFTVVVKHLTDKPELFRRLYFKDGEFNVDELPVGKYQLEISAPLFIGVRLTFDFGQQARGYLKETKKPAYAITHESVGGFAAKIVSPRTPGHGITGIYFRKLSGGDAFCLWGKDLTAMQQELVLKIFETIRFGGPVPPYVNPPPPPPAKNDQ